MTQGSKRYKFYREIMSVHIKEQERVYEQLISNISEKNAIECKKESVVALTLNDRADFVNIDHHRFYVDGKVRDLWNIITREIEKRA